MTEIEMYAVDVIESGAASSAQEDIDEEGVFDEEADWHKAKDLARDMAKVIKANPDAFLAWYRSVKLAEAVKG